MVFNTNIFIFFFLPITITFYYLFDKKYKKILLLLMSFIFYMFAGFNEFIYVFLLSIFNYFLSYLIKRCKNRWILLFSVSADVFLLIYSKYINYLIENINQYLQMNISLVELLVPLGFSFIIFNMISYLVDIYRDEKLFTRNIIDVELYFFLFTKILQGPIVLYKEFKPQLNNLKIEFNFFILGLEKFIIGLAKKVIIADTLTNLVTTILSRWTSSGIDVPTHWLVLVGYMFAIYFDWSGYSDMAIGISRMLGFDFKENFNFPYIATSITDFWRRWHISLGNWFKEYVYFPLGGGRHGNVYVNLLIVFILTGLWHGAGLLYLAWGLMHGIARLVEKYLMSKGLLDKIPAIIRWVYVTLVVSFGWLIFLMPSRDMLQPFLMEMFHLSKIGNVQFTFQYYFTTKIMFILMVAIIGSYIFSNKSLKQTVLKYENTQAFTSVKYIVLLCLLVVSLMMIMSGTYSPFIYFQF